MSDLGSDGPRTPGSGRRGRPPSPLGTSGSGPERWIVDGNNVMGSRPDGWWRDRTGAAARLVGQLAGLDRPGVDLVVVFDGPVPPGGADSGVQDMEVRHAGPASSADDLIVTLVEGAGQPTTVFTSDAELSRRVRDAGARVAGARSLLEMLESAGGSDGRPGRHSR